MVAPGSTKEICGHVFTDWGAHANNYRCAYLTAAAAVGMTKAEVDTFLKRLDKCLSRVVRKEAVVSTAPAVNSGGDNCQHKQQDNKPDKAQDEAVELVGNR